MPGVHIKHTLDLEVKGLTLTNIDGDVEVKPFRVIADVTHIVTVPASNENSTYHLNTFTRRTLSPSQDVWSEVIPYADSIFQHEIVGSTLTVGKAI